MQLAGKVAVVTGATSGIGAAMAERFVAEGARVVLGARREQVGQRLADRLGPDAAFVRTDVTVESDVAGVMAEAVRRWGRLDCVVNSAGAGGIGATVATVDLDRFERALRVHVLGLLACMKHAAAVMPEDGPGSIINVASIAGQLAGWTSIDYAAAKAAVIQLTRCAAVELAARGVRVNSISPGPTLTGIFAKAAGVDPEVADRHAGELEGVFLARLTDWQPLHHPIVPADVAPAAVWLASDGARCVTGQDLVVDGGVTAGRPASVMAADRAAMGAVLLAPRG